MKNKQIQEHSTAGILSFVIAIVSILGMAGALAAPSLLRPDPGDPGAYALIGGLIVLFLFTALGGALLGLVGLYQKNRSRLFPILGLAFNSAFVACFLIVSVFAAIFGSPLPGISD